MRLRLHGLPTQRQRNQPASPQRLLGTLLIIAGVVLVR
jgi:hypothetical protein